MTLEEEAAIAIVFIALVMALVMVASWLRPRVSCSTCGERIEAKTEVECDFCRRTRDARDAGTINYSTGQLMEKLLLHDVEMRRMYDHNVDRLGQAVSATTYLTAAVLFATGLAGALERVDLTDLTFMVGGLVVAGALKVWWEIAKYLEKRKRV